MSSVRQPALGDTCAQGLLYAGVGAVASLLDWSVFTAAHCWLGLQYVAAAALSLVVATFLNYLLSVRYVFAAGRFRRSLEVVLVYFVSTVGVGLNLGFMVLFVEFTGLAPLPAKMAATCLVFSWNYLARKHLVFAGPRPVQPVPLPVPLRNHRDGVGRGRSAPDRLKHLL